MLYNKAPIMWKSKMQKTTALSESMAEAKYYSASEASCEVLYLQTILLRRRLGYGQKKPIPVYEGTVCIEWVTTS